MRERIHKYSVMRMALAIISLLFLFNLSVSGQYNENIIKAAYIERITRFIEWPGKDNNLLHDNFIIGVFDDNEFYNTLINVFKEKPIKDHKVTIITIQSPEQINTCNLCYISDKAKPLLSKFVTAANASGVLLISETSGFCKDGVHINFYIDDERLKFEVNEKSIASAGFKVSYLLLQNTRIVQ